ncbi:MAG: class I SAM-dependent rRNA methyltransferase [Pirellulaceae bacterium]|nr:class I SAM-dependent rRNA methyltransferase [Pirellulaceae bacterium]
MGMVRSGRVVQIALRKPLERSVYQGHAWLFSDAIELPQAECGRVAHVLDRRGRTIAGGMYCSQHPIALRICTLEPPYRVDDAWLVSRMESAIALRQQLLNSSTTGYRLVAGEGDLLPGLIIDIYDRTAVIKLDGGAPEVFYQPQPIADWLRQRLELQAVLWRPRGRGTNGISLSGPMPAAPIEFLENGLSYSADVIRGQKTGFFLDQRDNRAVVRAWSLGREVLNLFSFNGGFSIAAGVGGAADVTSVDIAAPAIQSSQALWQLNGLAPQAHQGVVADCFEYLEQAAGQGRAWDLVICDPPSFAPSQQTRQSALAAYARLAQMAASVVRPEGLLALASCSSHVDQAAFTQACQEGLGRARRVGTLLSQLGLPADHPTPLAMPELRYLKFQLLRLS